MNSDLFISKLKEQGQILSAEYGLDMAIEAKQNIGYTSILCFNQVFLRLRTTKRGIMLEIKRSFINDFAISQDTLSGISSSPDWGRIMLTDEIEFLILHNLQTAYFHCYTLSSENTFGCCNSFLECSDAKRCVHPNKLFASGCLYRANLESGKIFYGKNRNID